MSVCGFRSIPRPGIMENITYDLLLTPDLGDRGTASNEFYPTRFCLGAPGLFLRDLATACCQIAPRQEIDSILLGHAASATCGHARQEQAFLSAVAGRSVELDARDPHILLRLLGRLGRLGRRAANRWRRASGHNILMPASNARYANRGSSSTQFAGLSTIRAVESSSLAGTAGIRRC